MKGFEHVRNVEQPQLGEQEAPHLGQVQLASLQLFVQEQLRSAGISSRTYNSVYL